MYNSMRPGQIWLDTEGKRIRAHGVLFCILNCSPSSRQSKNKKFFLPVG